MFIIDLCLIVLPVIIVILYNLIMFAYLQEFSSSTAEASIFTHRLRRLVQTSPPHICFLFFDCSSSSCILRRTHKALPPHSQSFWQFCHATIRMYMLLAYPTRPVLLGRKPRYMIDQWLVYLFFPLPTFSAWAAFQHFLSFPGFLSFLTNSFFLRDLICISSLFRDLGCFGQIRVLVFASLMVWRVIYLTRNATLSSW